MEKFSKEERLVLKWLSIEDSSSYGECRGAAMDRLLELGVAELGPEDARGDDFRRCWVSDYGWEVLGDMRDATVEADELSNMAQS